jgi:hypothetical protein
MTDLSVYKFTGYGLGINRDRTPDGDGWIVYVEMKDGDGTPVDVGLKVTVRTEELVKAGGLARIAVMVTEGLNRQGYLLPSAAEHIEKHLCRLFDDVRRE